VLEGSAEGLDRGSMIAAFFDSTSHSINRALQRASQKENDMKKLLTLTLPLLIVLTTGAMAQTSTSSSSKGQTSSAKQAPKRGPVFRANKDQINQAQALLKERGFYGGDQIGKLDDATREGLRKYQQAEGIKITGTLNKLTLEKMNIALTDKQKAM
jgi:hypothetical protein